VLYAIGRSQVNEINWKKLDHAYGVAGDIPGLLRVLSTYPVIKSYKDEPMFSLWSALCHQGTIYSASYAAVPIIVSLIQSAPENVHYDYFMLPISIHISYLHGRGPQIPDEFKQQYFDAINSLPELAANEQTDSELKVRILSSAIAVKSGNAALAEAIMELSPEILEKFEEWLQNEQ
jgi:hypothetical protein